MSERREPLFLERESYRQRRTIDAARLLPLLGFLALCLPILWGGGDGGARITSVGVIYLFGAWIVLIIAAVILARRLRRIEADQGAPD
ncbi:hypothetical protein [Profundibacter sp.]